MTESWCCKSSRLLELISKFDECFTVRPMKKCWMLNWRFDASCLLLYSIGISPKQSFSINITSWCSLFIPLNLTWLRSKIRSLDQEAKIPQGKKMIFNLGTAPALDCAMTGTREDEGVPLLAGNISWLEYIDRSYGELSLQVQYTQGQSNDV